MLALLALLVLTGARDPILVAEISQHEVQVRQGFTGADLMVYGALLAPDGTRAGGDYDIVVVLKGPTRSIVLREKQKVAGMWINAASGEFRSAPSYFAVAASRPVEQIVDKKTAAIYELGLPWLQLSPIGSIDPAEQKRFAAGLVDLKLRGGLFRQDPAGVGIKEQVLYQARFLLPSNVEVGRYTAETFAINRGRVVASATTHVDVRKLGFEGIVADFAQNNGFLYGMLAILLSVTMGWLAGRIFAMR